MSIESAIYAASQTFLTGILTAIKETMLSQVDDLFAGAETAGTPAKRGPGRPKVSKTPTKSGRLARRSPEEIAKAVAKVVSFLKKGPARAEAIKAATGLSPKELPRVLKQGLADKAFRIVAGQKRATCYGIKTSAKPKAKVAHKGKKASAKPKAPKAKAAKKHSPKATKASAKPKTKAMVNGASMPATLPPMA